MLQNTALDENCKGLEAAATRRSYPEGAAADRISWTLTPYGVPRRLRTTPLRRSVGHPVFFTKNLLIYTFSLYIFL